MHRRMESDGESHSDVRGHLLCGPRGDLRTHAEGDSHGEPDGFSGLSSVPDCRLPRRYPMRRLRLDGPSTLRTSPAR